MIKHNEAWESDHFWTTSKTQVSKWEHRIKHNYEKRQQCCMVDRHGPVSDHASFCCVIWTGQHLSCSVRFSLPAFKVFPFTRCFPICRDCSVTIESLVTCPKAQGTQATQAQPRPSRGELRANSTFDLSENNERLIHVIVSWRSKQRARDWGRKSSQATNKRKIRSLLRLLVQLKQKPMCIIWEAYTHVMSKLAGFRLLSAQTETLGAHPCSILVLCTCNDATSWDVAGFVTGWAKAAIIHHLTVPLPPMP